MFRWCLPLLTLTAAAALAVPNTPEIYVNGKLTMAQIGEKGRVYIDYDVRSVGGSGLLLKLYGGTQDMQAPPIHEWTFTKPNGHERISLNDQPISVYRIVGVAVDAQGQPVAGPSWAVPVEYGGWRAWRNQARPLSRDLRAQAPPFEGLTPGGGAGAAVLELSPATSVLNPKETKVIQAHFSAMEAGEGVDWELEGEGSLEHAEGMQVTYRAPEESNVNQIVRIRARAKARPDLTALSTVLLTSMKREEAK